MSSASTARAKLIDIAGERRPWMSMPIAMSGPTASRMAATTSTAARFVAEESTGSVGSCGATLSAVKPASAIRRALSAYSSGDVPRGPFA